MSGRVVHFEVPFEDGDRARGFYRDAFGWELTRMGDMPYTLVSTGPTGDRGPTEPGYIGGGMFERVEPIASPVLVIEVEDIDAALASVESLSGSVVRPREAVGDMGWSAYFKDPEGNVLGLWQSA